MTDQPRRHASGGAIYQVESAPAGAGSALGRRTQTLVFTRESDGAVLSVRVPNGTDLRWLTGDDLDDLLNRGDPQDGRRGTPRAVRA